MTTSTKKKPADLTEYALRKIRREIRELQAAVAILQNQVFELTGDTDASDHN